MKFIVKRAQLHSAAFNPFRPKQRMKRGKWVTFGAFDTLEEAVVKFNQMNNGVGLYDYRIMHGGVSLTRRHPSGMCYEVKRPGETEWRRI